MQHVHALVQGPGQLGSMIFINFSSGQNGWYVGPLLFVLPMLLQYGSLLTFLAETIRMLAQLLGIQPGRPDVHQLALHFIILGASTFGLLRLFRYVRRNGGVRAVLRLLFLGAHGGHAAQGPGPQARRAPGQPPKPPRATIEQVAAELLKLRTELFASPADLEAMTVHELKERISAGGMDASRFLEKRELVQCLLDSQGNSSSSTCAICSEDYVSGDVLRVLRCGHTFHIECVDKWLLSCDFSRPPACPMCNAELLKH